MSSTLVQHCINVIQNVLRLLGIDSEMTSHTSMYIHLNPHDFLGRGVKSAMQQTVNPLTAKLFNLNFHPLEVVSR